MKEEEIMFSHTPSFENKNALIVGGSSGIGKEAALALGRQGAKVTVLGRRFKHTRSPWPDLIIIIQDLTPIALARPGSIKASTGFI